MSSLSTNPLSKHFRQPVLYIKLPSNGRWYPEGALELPVTGEVPIYAMTARDEITFKTPDALMNGASTVQVIESCCPSIKNAWKMPAVDLDPVLIAIRLATYGKEMEFTGVCPHCGTANEKAIDLTAMLDRVIPADWSAPVVTNGMEIILKPQNYEDFNKNNLMRFEEQRVMQVVQSDELDDQEKTTEFNKVFQRLIETGINQVSKSIAGIKLEDNTVVDNPEHIKEFLENCDRSVWEAIKEKLDAIKTATNFNDVTLTCESPTCGKDFVTPFIFEQSNFFG
jgi:rubredoxin